MPLLLLPPRPYVGGVTAASEPEFHVFVAFTTDPLSTNPVWSAIPDTDVRSVTIDRGRTRELDQFSAGTCTVTLDNRDRLYDPEYDDSAFVGLLALRSSASGSHYRQLLPMKRVSVQATWNGITWPLFDGFTDSWDLQYTKPNDAVCILRASDGFKPLAAIDLPQSAWEAEVIRDTTVTSWYRLGGNADDTVITDAVGSKHGEWDSIVPQPGGSIITREPDGSATFSGTEVGSIVGGGVSGTSWTIGCWIILPPFASTVTEGGQTFIMQGAGSITDVIAFRIGASNSSLASKFRLTVNGTNADSDLAVADNERHFIMCTRSGNTISVFIDGELDSTATVTNTAATTSNLYFGRGFSTDGKYVGVLDEVVLWNTALVAADAAVLNALGRTPWRLDLSGDRVDRIADLADWPANLRAVEVGQSELQSASLGDSALAQLQKVDRTERGRLFMSKNGLLTLQDRATIQTEAAVTSQATFGDSGSELRYEDITLEYNDHLIINEARISREEGVSQVVTSSTSITKYTRHTRSDEGLLHRDDAVSRNIGEFLVDRYKEPFTQITSLSILPRRDKSNLLPQAFGRELGDWITVRRRPPGGGPLIEKVAAIEGIHHQIDTGAKEIRTTFDLSVADASKKFWLLGVSGRSELGINTYLYLRMLRFESDDTIHFGSAVTRPFGAGRRMLGMGGCHCQRVRRDMEW